MTRGLTSLAGPWVSDACRTEDQEMQNLSQCIKEKPRSARPWLAARPGLTSEVFLGSMVAPEREGKAGYRESRAASVSKRESGRSVVPLVKCGDCPVCRCEYISVASLARHFVGGVASMAGPLYYTEFASASCRWRSEGGCLI
jgi:hypothetical protein